MASVHVRVWLRAGRGGAAGACVRFHRDRLPGRLDPARRHRGRPVLRRIQGPYHQMDRQFADARFWTVYVEDKTDGFAGLRLHRERLGKATVAAEVIFWDAVGQYFVQTFNGDVPVEIIEAVIAEAKERVKVR